MRTLRFTLDDLGLAVDLSGMGLDEAWLSRMAEPMEAALGEMGDLVAGAEANRDEGLQVGHYWLRAPGLAPSDHIRDAILADREERCRLVDALDGRFGHVLLCGVGGSALGPMLLSEALAPRDGPRQLHVLDNADPERTARILAGLDLEDVLVVVVSKSGTTAETCAAERLVRVEMDRAGLLFSGRAIAITAPGSPLDDRAREEDWKGSLAIWPWVGGRTSITSSAGCLPAALLGLDVDGFLAGACALDAAVCASPMDTNPAAMMALAWYRENGAATRRNLVVLPYRDRFSRLPSYIQQLVMESLGKARDRGDRRVHHGLTVYGEKGSTAQHAIIQQLRDGPDDAFICFVEVLQDEGFGSQEIEPGVTAGDLLSAMLQGTRSALQEAGRHTMTVTLGQLDARSLGALVALFEWTVSLYAALMNLNAYHQPGVEAGKESARAVLQLQARILEAIDGQSLSLAGLAETLSEDPAQVRHILRHLVANGRVGGSEQDGEAVFQGL